jgi:hypothetical protein
MATTILPYKHLGEVLATNLDVAQIPHRVIGEHSILIDRSAAGSSLAIDIEAQVPTGIADAFPKQERANHCAAAVSISWQEVLLASRSRNRRGGSGQSLRLGSVQFGIIAANCGVHFFMQQGC